MENDTNSNLPMEDEPELHIHGFKIRRKIMADAVNDELINMLNQNSSRYGHVIFNNGDHNDGKRSQMISTFSQFLQSANLSVDGAGPLAEPQWERIEEVVKEHSVIFSKSWCPFLPVLIFFFLT
jgi:hypothetical protein